MTTPFTKHFTTNDLLTRYGGPRASDREERIHIDIIHHMETKFEALEEELTLLKYGEDQIKKREKKSQLQIGWVYKDTRNDDVIIYKMNEIKSEDQIEYFVGLHVRHSNSHQYSPDGLLRYNGKNYQLDLSTGKKWEPAE